MSTRADEIRAELVRRELARRKSAASEAPPAEKELGIDDLTLPEIALGAGDVVRAGAAGLLDRIRGTGRGIAGAVRSDDTYMDAKSRAGSSALSRMLGGASPLTESGDIVNEALGGAMRYTGLPQLTEAVGSGVESLAGPEARDALGTVAEVAALRLPFGKTRAVTPLAQAVETAERTGYLTPAYAVTSRSGARAGGAIERAAEGVAGLDAADALKALRNQNVTDRLAARAGRLYTEYVTPGSLAAAVKRAELPYENIRQTKFTFVADPAYFKAVDDLTGSQYSGKGVRLPVDDAVTKLQSAMRAATRHSADSLIDQVGVLRSQGFRALGGVDDAAALRGAAQLKAADALEELMERGLIRAANRAQTRPNGRAAAALLRKLIADYRDGRAWRSDLHVIQESVLPGGTGVVDAHRLARISNKREGLKNPILQQIADVANNFPGVTTALPQAARGTAKTGLSAASRTDVGILGATIGKLLGRGALRSSQSRRAGSTPSAIRAGSRAATAAALKGEAVSNLIEEDEL